MINFIHNQLQLTEWGPYLCFEKFLNANECSRLIAEMPERKLERAKVDVDGKDNTDIRSTLVCALDYSERMNWIFKKLEEAICQANHGVYGFDILGFHEVLQLMEYREEDHYNWHMDSGNQQFSRRKLSVSIQLSDKSDYEGGELEFFQNGMGPKDKGAMILFPSYMYHRVLPITSGVRRALVGWVSGNPYR